MEKIIKKFEHDNFKEIFQDENVICRLQKECSGNLIQKPKIYYSKKIYTLNWKGYEDDAIYYFDLLCNELSSYKTLTLNKKREDGDENISFIVNYNLKTKASALEYIKNYNNDDIYRFETFKVWENYIRYCLAFSITDITKLEEFSLIKNFLKSYLYIDNFCTLDSSKFLVKTKKSDEVVKLVERKDLIEVCNEGNLTIEDEIIRRVLLK